MTPQEMVTKFHKTYGLPTPAFPTLPPDRTELRYELIAEELEELEQALAEEDLVAVADALADLVYVVYGAAIEFGLDLDALVAEVHRSNMTKLFTRREAAERMMNGEGGLSFKAAPGHEELVYDGRAYVVYREDGKVLKGPAFEEPELAAVITKTVIDRLGAVLGG